MNWTQIPDWNGWYDITESGDVRISPTAPPNLYARRQPGDLIQAHYGRDGGYLRINLKDPVTHKFGSHHVHRLLMRAFRPTEGWEELQVNHVDGERTNNTLSNLEWCTQHENLRHAWKHGLRSRPDRSILTAAQASEIRAFRATDEGMKTPMREIGARYGVTSSAVWRVIHNKNWKHLL